MIMELTKAVHARARHSGDADAMLAGSPAWAGQPTGVVRAARYFGRCDS